MRKRDRSFMEALAILITLLVLVSSLSSPNTPDIGDPGDFYSVSKEVSLNEMVATANDFKGKIYVPYNLPDNLELTTIYLKEYPFVAILVYSINDNKDYKTAELTIQISTSTDSPTYNELLSQAEDQEHKSALNINDWLVLVNEKANIGSEKWGVYGLLITAWIDGMRYMICCPILTKNDAVQMVENMYLLTL